jgi:hypothetical protein
MDRRFRDMLMMDYATKNTGGLLGGQQGATGGLLGGLSNINPNSFNWCKHLRSRYSRN